METLSVAKNLIEKSQNIFIIPSPDLQGDSLGSAIALFFTLKKLGKNVNAVTEKFSEKFQFLIDLLNNYNNDFTISIDTKGKEISQMRYERNEKDLKIYLTLNKGGVGPEDISLLSNLPANISFAQKPGLVITLGAKSLEDLGEFFEKNSRIFYETPILNIDNQQRNENFGEVNLIEITSPLAEITTNLIKSMDSENTILNGDIATCLLAGIIYASQNFRSQRTRPRTFETSAFLIEKGADHQGIIQRLYKQKSLPQIKLLGRVLEKLNFNEKKELYLATLTWQDFQDCQALSRDLSFVIEELKFNFQYLPNLLILWESHASSVLIKGVFYSSNLNSVEKILENFEGVFKEKRALFLIRENDLNLAQEKVLQII